MKQKKCKIKLKEPKGMCACGTSFPVNTGRKREFCDNCRKQRKQKYDINYQRKQYKIKQVARLQSKKNKTEKERLRLFSLMKESIQELGAELESEFKDLEQDKSAHLMMMEGERCAPEQAKYRKKVEELRIIKIIDKRLQEILPPLLGIKKS